MFARHGNPFTQHPKLVGIQQSLQIRHQRHQRLAILSHCGDIPCKIRRIQQLIHTIKSIRERLSCYIHDIISVLGHAHQFSVDELQKHLPRLFDGNRVVQQFGRHKTIGNRVQMRRDAHEILGDTAPMTDIIHRRRQQLPRILHRIHRQILILSSCARRQPITPQRIVINKLRQLQLVRLKRHFQRRIVHDIVLPNALHGDTHANRATVRILQRVRQPHRDIIQSTQPALITAEIMQRIPNERCTVKRVKLVVLRRHLAI
mmetsp:Transcript_8969/g.13843  ORF Transcript_8969/g.13843 Transcript_8969/m.13843 type:complete len:260 (+) Transcript_8969:378-1157(+)